MPLAIRDVWLLWGSKQSFIVIRISIMAPPGKRSSFFLLGNILYLHSPGSSGGDSGYLVLRVIEGERQGTFPTLLTKGNTD